MRTVVLDTNVLLSDPSVIFAYPDAEVVIPETVLGEIDKLKTSRVDPELRFKGREVSRILFGFSEEGSLIDGVDLPDGGRVRVVPIEDNVVLPEGMSTRNADDKILAVAFQVCSAGCEGGLTLVTNDLNMLLKAQTLGLKVERRLELEAGLGKRAVRWFQRYKVPLTILAISLGVFAGVLLLSLYTSRLTAEPQQTSVPMEVREVLSQDQLDLLDGMLALQRNQSDANAIKQVGDAYFGLREQTGNSQYAAKGIDYYTRYLQLFPDDNDVKTDRAALYFYNGKTDLAIQESTAVLQADPSHIQGNFNLGIFYWQGRTDYANGAQQFKRVIDLATGSTDPLAATAGDRARGALQQLQVEATQAGVEIEIEPQYLSEGTTS